MWSVADLCYLAGLFDGEGTIYIMSNKIKQRTPKQYALRIVIGMTSREVIQWVSQTFGGRIYIEPRGIHVPIWKWMPSQTRTLIVLKAILPFLKLKGSQAEVGIKFQEHMRMGGIQRRIVSQQDLDFREMCKTSIHRLNRAYKTNGYEVSRASTL